MKIAYCLNSISHVGGIESVTVAKANALAESGNEVYVIVTDHEAGAGPGAGLSPDVHLVDLGIDYYDDDWKSKWNVLKGFFIKRREHKRRLSAALTSISPDVAVSVGQSEKYMLPEIKGGWVSVREQHYPKDFRRRAAASRSLFYKIAARLSDFYDYRCKIGEYDRIVVLTDEDRTTNWGKTNKVSVIPNPIIFRSRAVSPLTERKVIAVGRLAAQKNFSSLIRAFGAVVDKHPDWTLEIWGEGSEREALQRQIEDSNLAENVLLCGSTNRVQQKMLEASCFVLSSKYEGLPLVMLEAMSCGLPVVSYACPCGPRDIIDDGVDGFLVPTDDEQLLAERICGIIENPYLRREMGAAARRKSENYSPQNIIPRWMALFIRLLNKKTIKC